MKMSFAGYLSKEKEGKNTSPSLVSCLKEAKIKQHNKKKTNSRDDSRLLMHAVVYSMRVISFLLYSLAFAR
jgi:hypothetical protein